MFSVSLTGSSSLLYGRVGSDSQTHERYSDAERPKFIAAVYLHKASYTGHPF